MGGVDKKYNSLIVFTNLVLPEPDLYSLISYLSNPANIPSPERPCVLDLLTGLAHGCQRNWGGEGHA
jgi:hypothetical protein